MEGLTTLRPKLVQRLLEECKSVKVRRLFLFMAESSNHDWVKELNVEKIDLGSGKRVIVKNGVLDKKYKITVPKPDMKDSIFFKQANLLLRVLPIINEHKVFALKGGTAINFFVQNLPRLSVDIDLTYLVISTRNESLTDITTKLNEICSSIERKSRETKWRTLRQRKIKNLLTNFLFLTN